MSFQKIKFGDKEVDKKEFYSMMLFNHYVLFYLK